MDYPPDPNDPFDEHLIRRDRSAEINAGLAALTRHFDAKPAYRSYKCVDCGVPIKAITYANGRREMLDAATFEQHCCPRPVRIEPVVPAPVAPPSPVVRRDPPPRPPSNPPKLPATKDELILI